MKKLILTIAFILVCSGASAQIANKPIEDFAPNELNRTNTHEDSGIVEINVNGVRFAVGFWSTAHPGTGEPTPMAAFIVWTPDGWITVAKLPPIWNNDLEAQMTMGDDQENLRQYMWWIGEQWTRPMQEYLETAGENTVSLEHWRNILELMKTGREEGGQLVFDRSF